jgi:hypothetical protein
VAVFFRLLSVVDMVLMARKIRKVSIAFSFPELRMARALF